MNKTHLNWHEKHQAQQSFGDRVADSISSRMGSWRFIIIQTVIITIWVAGNVWLLFHFDPFPFIFLNLAFSAQAAYSTPIIMMSQNRQASRDKVQAEHQYETQELELQKLMEINKRQMAILEGQDVILKQLVEVTKNQTTKEVI